MVHAAAVDDPLPEPPHCWCCGSRHAAEQAVYLGQHPEVSVCLGCAHFLSKRATEIEDRDRTGVAVRARDVLRGVRGFVIGKGLHEHPLLGRPLRWLGRRTP